jgi:hypothetical protein
MSMFNGAAKPARSNPVKTVSKLLLLGLFLVLLLPVLFPYFVYDYYLRFKFSRAYAKTGRFILFIYSNSPDWKLYIEAEILPVIQPYTQVLNWSERRTWKEWSWPVQAFHHWGGTKDFNPLAIVYTGRSKVRVVRFYRAFKDFKHGKEGPLREAEAELFALVKARG